MTAPAAANEALARARAEYGVFSGVTDLGELRRLYESLGAKMTRLSEVDARPAADAPVRSEWVNGQSERDGALLFLHGGGYMIGSLITHRHLASEIARQSGIKGLIIDFRRAPEDPFPAAVDDALASYRYLLESGVPAERIALAGDSAGGGLAISLMLTLKQLGLPQPACAVCISPYLDLECDSPSMLSKASVDPVVSRDAALGAANLYLGGQDPRAGVVGVLQADLSGIAPLLIQVGSAECLLDDSVRLAGQAGLHDVAATLEVWPNMVHVWQYFFPILPEGERAIGRIAQFIRSALQVRSTSEALEPA